MHIFVDQFHLVFIGHFSFRQSLLFFLIFTSFSIDVTTSARCLIAPRKNRRPTD